MPRYLSQYSE